MPIYWIRHGYATHNRDFETKGEAAFFDEKNTDAPLIDPQATGELVYQSMLKDHGLDLRKDMCLVFSSPLTRCLQTAIAATNNQLSIIATDYLLERQGPGYICNQRKPKSQLEQLFPTVSTFLLREEEYPSSKEIETDDALCHRARSVIRLHQTCPTIPLVFFSHHDIIKAVCGKSLKNGEILVYSSDECNQSAAINDTKASS